MLVRRLAFALFVAIATSSRAAAQAPADLVRRAIDAMGGEQALRAVTSTTTDYYLATFGIGQSELPESPPRVTISTGRFYHDFGRMRRAVNSDNRQITGQVTRQRQVATPEGGMNDVAGAQTVLGGAAVFGQMRFLRTQVDRLMLTALDNPGTVSPVPARNLRGSMSNGIRIAGQDTISVWFDRVTGLPLLLEAVTDDPILGDRATQTWLTRYQPSGSVRLPRQVDVEWNGQLNQQAWYSSVAVNAPLSDTMFTLPDSIMRRTQPAAAAPAAPTPITVTMNQLGPSVWRAEGATHHTLVVEQPDQIVLVEAPLSTERVRAVLDTVRGRFPGKRIGTVVMTHYHWDHASGIREIVAEGIPIVTMEQNAGFVRQVAAARRTTRPDLQAQRRRTPTLRTFTDSMVIGSGETAVVLYRMPSIHAEGLLAAWAPSARVLFTSDVVNPGPQGQVGQPGSGELAALARSRGLSPEKYAGGHGVLINWPDIQRASNP